MTRTIALAALILVAAQASAFATTQHLKTIGEQCAVQLKLPPTACACISSAAGEQLSDTQQAFMVAQITKDKAAMASLQSSMTVGEMTVVGNFMTSIVGQCQR